MSPDSIDRAIFLLSESGALEKVPMTEYDAEDRLQSLIEKHPELLAGDQISPDRPLRWILVKREAGIPSAEEQGDRWSVDHLLLDQDGIPTFVETKRSSDTRIRREVVGQMLDYAANAQRYWPVDRIRSMAATQHGGSESADAVIMEMLRLDSSEEEPNGVDAYWASVNDNLREGRLRLLFVADRLPAELRRAIEFLNEQMDNTEVLGVELAQYAGSNIRALVPRVYGQTEAIRQRKQPSRPARKLLTYEQFLSSCSPDAREFFQRAVADSKTRGLQLAVWTKGITLMAQSPSGAWKSLMYGYPSGGPSGNLAILQGYVANIQDSDQRERVRSRFLEIPGTIASGKYTVTLELKPESLENAEKLLQIVWEVADELRQGRDQSQ